MVFASEKAPKNRKAFMEWCSQQTKWKENHSYDDPKVLTPELRSWFLEIITMFPPMNGPYSPGKCPADELFLTDYSIGQYIIYAGFAWSKSELAYETVFRLATKSGVGFYDVNSKTEDVWFPDGKGNLNFVF